MVKTPRHSTHKKEHHLVMFGRADQTEQREKKDEDAKGDEAADEELVRADLAYCLQVRSCDDEEKG